MIAALARGGSSARQPSTGLLMDPRFAERRLRIARARGRRRRRRVLALLLITIATLAGLVLAHSPLLDVDRVTVVGAGQSGDDVVLAVAGVRHGDALVSLDAEAVARRVETLPWIADASVTRSWTGSVRITVIERVPVAVAGTSWDRVLVDRDGLVLGAAPASSALPDIGDIRPTDAPGRRLRAKQTTLLDVINSTPGDRIGDLVSLRSTPDGIEAVLRPGVVVVLGDTSQIRTKFDSVTAILANYPPNSISRIDVSVPSVPALTRSATTGA